MLGLATITIRARRLTLLTRCEDGLIRGATICACMLILDDLADRGRVPLEGLIIARRVIRDRDRTTLGDDEEERAYARERITVRYDVRTLCVGARDLRLLTSAMSMTYPEYTEAL